MSFKKLLILFLALVDFTVCQNETDVFDHVGRVWDVIIETCDKEGSGIEEASYINIFYKSGLETEVFHLNKPGNDALERGSRAHFKIQFSQSDIVNMALFWWPGFSVSGTWCVNYVMLMNADIKVCYEGIFEKWVLHYKIPPTYATQFRRLRFADCVRPSASTAARRKLLKGEDVVKKSDQKD